MKMTESEKALIMRDALLGFMGSIEGDLLLEMNMIKDEYEDYNNAQETYNDFQTSMIDYACRIFEPNDHPCQNHVMNEEEYARASLLINDLIEETKLLIEVMNGKGYGDASNVFQDYTDNCLDAERRLDELRVKKTKTSPRHWDWWLIQSLVNRLDDAVDKGVL